MCMKVSCSWERQFRRSSISDLCSWMFRCSSATAACRAVAGGWQVQHVLFGMRQGCMRCLRYWTPISSQYPTIIYFPKKACTPTKINPNPRCSNSVFVLRRHIYVSGCGPSHGKNDEQETTPKVQILDTYMVHSDIHINVYLRIAHNLFS